MNLEQKRKELELRRVEMARSELEFKIEERLEEIERIRIQVGIQLAKEDELKQDLISLKSK